MAKLRWFRAELAGESPAKVRWYRAEITGATTRLRWYRAAVAGSASPTLLPFAPQVDVEPQELITLTAAPFPGSNIPASYNWRQVSGPPVTLSGSGATRTFETPSDLDGGVVVVAVSGTVSGVTGAEEAASITVLPQLSWVRAQGVAGGAWVGSKVRT